MLESIDKKHNNILYWTVKKEIKPLFMIFYDKKHNNKLLSIGTYILFCDCSSDLQLFILACFSEKKKNPWRIII